MSATYKSKLRSHSRKRKSPDSEETSSTNNVSLIQPTKKRKLSEPAMMNKIERIQDVSTDDEETESDTDSKSRSRSVSSSHVNNTDFIQFNIRSWCWMDKTPYKSYIKLTNNLTDSKGLKIYDPQVRRGHRIVIIDGISGDIEQTICFDTWGDIYSGIRLRIFLQTLQYKPNKWVIITIHDSGYNINTEAAWNELEKWGAKKDEHPQHREAYILIFSTNLNQNWWEYIKDPHQYFEERYNETIYSWKKRRKSSKKKKGKKSKHKKKKMDEEDVSNFITDSQFKLLSSFGGKNVFFQRKTPEKKGPILLKGYLPKMKAVPVQNDGQYSVPTPYELAIEKGIKPCDTETNQFYCISCLNNSDRQHMLICTDQHHAKDDSVRITTEKANQYLNKDNYVNLGLSLGDFEEAETLYRVQNCGQAFHIYCITYPDDIWKRWCNFMKVPFDAKSRTPGFIELNIRKKKESWRKVEKVKNKFIKDIQTKPDEKEMESDKILKAKQKQTMLYYKKSQKKIKRMEPEEFMEEYAYDDTSNSLETGLKDPYRDFYADYRLTPKIRDLSKWRCFSHRNGNRIFCPCGKPMVEQLCENANGETKRDSKKFKGLYCNNYNDGCRDIIKPKQTVFRCMNGARCKGTNDGWDYCMKCMVEIMTKMKPELRCLCGNQLVLGTVQSVKTIFNGNQKKQNVDNEHNGNVRTETSGMAFTEALKGRHLSVLFPRAVNRNNGDSLSSPLSSSSSPMISCDSSETDTSSECSKSGSITIKLPENENLEHQKPKRVIKKANTYLCAWCLKKFENKTENLYYCTKQSNKCTRIIKNHLMQFQPFVVCIGCVVQSDWMTQTCTCGCNLHCRLLADWIHHDAPAYDQNILQSVPLKPNSFQFNPNNNHNHKGAIDDDNDSVMRMKETCSSELAYDFYVERRANDDEEVYYNELSRKYVNCKGCNVEIDAYKFVFICNNHSKHGQKTHYFCGKCAIKQRQTAPLFPTCQENVEICLLFVAHDGISQSKLWEKWLNEDESIRKKIGIAVQCNNYEKLKSGKAFAERYRIDVQRPTSWGKLLVPLTIQKSIQISLTKYPNCKRFYIISGREIPLVSIKHLYSMPNKTQIMAKKVTKQTATKLRRKRMGKLVQWYMHHAAMCLSRDHAEMISVAPWKEYFNDSDQLFDFVGAPDEFLFGTTLNAMGVNMRKEIWREVTTDFELPPMKSVRHPIHWEQLNKVMEFWKVNEAQEIVGKDKKSLKQLLVDRYENPSRLWGYGPCFFRKIAASVRFNKFIPWKKCTMKPPVIDEENGIDETLEYREELDSSAYMDQDEIQEKLFKNKMMIEESKK